MTNDYTSTRINNGEFEQHEQDTDDEGFLAEPNDSDNHQDTRQRNDFTLGDSIDGYRLIKKIGSGGTSIVYLAECDAPHQPQVAIKIFNRSIRDKSSRIRFDRETSALQLLDHPHIAKLIDFGVTRDNHPFIVFEYINGSRIDLHCHQGDTSLEERAALLIKVCSALQHAHDQGIIHRDLKPGNIIVSRVGIPYLTDFGLSKLADESSPDSEKTRTGTILGTLNYLAPEQLFAIENNATFKTDVFGLGAVLHVLLTGKPPLEFENIVEAATAYFGRLPIKIDSRHHVPQSLESICIKCLSPNPSARYSTAQAVGDDLQRFMDGLPVLAKNQKLARRVSGIARQHPLLFRTSILAFLATVIASVVFFGLWQSSERNFQRADQKISSLKTALVAFSDYVRSLEDSPDTMLDRRDLLQIISNRYADFEEEFDSDPELLFNAAVNDFKLARLEQLIGNQAPRLIYFHRAETMYRRLIDNVPDHEKGRFGLFHVLLSIPDYESALVEIIQLETRFPTEIEYSAAVGHTYLAIAGNHISKGRFDEAQPLVEIGTEYANRLQEHVEETPRFRREWVQSRELQAQLAIARGDLDQADALIRDAIQQSDLIDKLGSQFASESNEYLSTLKLAFSIAAFQDDLGRAVELKSLADQHYIEAQKRFSHFIDLYWFRFQMLKEQAAFFASHSMKSEIAATQDDAKTVLDQWASNSVTGDDYWSFIIWYHSNPFFQTIDLDQVFTANQLLSANYELDHGKALLRLGDLNSASDWFEKRVARFASDVEATAYLQLVRQLVAEGPEGVIVPSFSRSERLQFLARRGSYAATLLDTTIQRELDEARKTNAKQD